MLEYKFSLHLMRSSLLLQMLRIQTNKNTLAFLDFKKNRFLFLSLLDMRDQQQYPLQVKWAAFAGLLFFSFLVQWQLDNHSLNFEAKDESFVRGYIKLGKWVLVFSFIIALLR